MCARPTWSARLGGDEFGVLLWNVSEAHAAAKARDLERTIEQTRVAHNGATLLVGASGGIAPLRPDGKAAEVIDAADKEMYARKQERREK